MKKIKGLVAAAYTPMNDDESINLDKIPLLIDYAKKQKFAGLFAVGSTGEFPSLTTFERKEVAKAYLESANHEIPIIINVGSCSYKESIELAEHAVKYDADAICVMAPFYFRPASVRDLADYVKKIIPACADKDVFIYHAPGITNVNLSMYDFLSIMLDEVPTFAGMKFTNENLYEFERCVNLSNRLQIFAGRDEMLLGALAMGATAAVGTTFNYIPRLYNLVIENFDRGDMEQARYYMSLSHKVIEISCRYGLPSIKTLMKFAGVDIGPMRSPVNRLSLEQETMFYNELKAANVTDYIG